VTAEELWSGTHVELGNFATGVYTLASHDGPRTPGNDVVLSREGEVWVNDGSYPVRVQKTVSLKSRASSFEIRYDLVQRASTPLRVMFGVEFAINLLAGSAFDHYYRSEDKDLYYAKLGEMGCDEGLSHIALRDDWQRLECGFQFSRPARVYRFAIETVSQSENGQERVYQGSVVIPCWVLTCEPEKEDSLTVQVEILAV
jgi:alpha-amylase